MNLLNCIKEGKPLLVREQTKIKTLAESRYEFLFFCLYPFLNNFLILNFKYHLFCLYFKKPYMKNILKFHKVVF